MVDKLIKRKEAAEMLGISLDTLDHARMEGIFGGECLFLSESKG